MKLEPPVDPNFPLSIRERQIFLWLIRIAVVFGLILVGLVFLMMIGDGP